MASSSSLPRRSFPHPEKDLERRIVLLGKTGAGKSSSGNTILGGNHFTSAFSFSSVTSQCEVGRAVVAGRRVRVVDTPGLFDTKVSPEVLAKEIGRSIIMSSPGAHAFLYVHPITVRFTDQEEEVFDKLEKMFGEEMRKYSIILFTHGDEIEGQSVERMIEGSERVRKLVKQCAGYHVFNNKDQRNRQQVTDLLEKIDRMVNRNGGSCFTNEMFMDATRSHETFWEKWGKHLLIAVGILFGIAVVGALAFGTGGLAVAVGGAAVPAAAGAEAAGLAGATAAGAAVPAAAGAGVTAAAATGTGAIAVAAPGGISVAVSGPYVPVVVGGVAATLCGGTYLANQTQPSQRQ